MAVEFSFQKTISLSNRTALKAFISAMFRREGKRQGNISIVFCSDDFILDINRSYLNHNYYTDIITFDLSPRGQKEIDAEIYISVDTIRHNATLFKSGVKKELHRVIFHGLLHLCGYKDKSPAEKVVMTQMEDFYLSLYFSVPRETS